jgi:hypothetical protein
MVVWGMRCTYKILVGKPQKNIPLGRSKMHFGDVWYEGVD